jgi:hypothetical protein
MGLKAARTFSRLRGCPKGQKNWPFILWGNTQLLHGLLEKSDNQVV